MIPIEDDSVLPLFSAFFSCSTACWISFLSLSSNSFKISSISYLFWGVRLSVSEPLSSLPGNMSE